MPLLIFSSILRLLLLAYYEKEKAWNSCVIHWFQVWFVHKRRLCLFCWVWLRNYINDRNSQKHESFYKENILTIHIPFDVYDIFFIFLIRIRIIKTQILWPPKEQFRHWDVWSLKYTINIGDHRFLDFFYFNHYSNTIFLIIPSFITSIFNTGVILIIANFYIIEAFILIFLSFSSKTCYLIKEVNLRERRKKRIMVFAILTK